MKNFWDNITKIADGQRRKGLQTYGQTIEENRTLNLIETLTMLEEELVDSLMYIEKFKDIMSHSIIGGPIYEIDFSNDTITSYIVQDIGIKYADDWHSIHLMGKSLFLDYKQANDCLEKYMNEQKELNEKFAYTE